MNHPREEQHQAKQDVDEKILADPLFEKDGDRRQKKSEQDLDQLVHDSRTPRKRERDSSRLRFAALEVKLNRVVRQEQAPTESKLPNRVRVIPIIAALQ
jgi:hypothetical protein